MVSPRNFPSLAMEQWTLLDPSIAARLREALVTGSIEDLLDLWQALDDEIGSVDDSGVRQRLVALRERVVGDMVTSRRDAVRRTAQRSPSDAWADWQTSVAHAMSLFRLRFAATLCGGVDLDPRRSDEVRAIEEGARAALQGRWAEACPVVRTLADAEHVPALVRARLLTTLAQVDLLHLARLESAKKLLDVARALAPDDGRVLAALGDWHARAEEGETAVELYHGAIRSAPRLSLGYVGLGEYYEEKQQADDAEHWYRRAVSAACGDSTGYLRLLRLFGRRERFAKHRRELQELFDRTVAVSPDDEQQACIELARAYLDNNLPSEADAWFARAIQADPTAPIGYVSLAAAREKEERFDEAAAQYEQAIRVAPEAYDGHFGLAFLHERQQQWDKALAAWQGFPRHVEEWAALARARVGTAYMQLGDLEAAERTLMEALEEDEANKAAKHGLEQLADELGTQRGDRASAIRIYDDLLATLGESYRATYLNRIGHLHLKDGETDEAIRHFHEALEIAPSDPAAHRGLADVYERLQEYSRAAAHHEQAFQLDRDAQRLNMRMAVLKNAEGNDAYTRGDYLGAAALYEQAIAYAPRDAVLHGNLAGAYERAEPSDGVSYLDKALAAYTRAHEASATPEYEQSIARLRLKLELMPAYCEKTLRLMPAVTPVALEVASDLIPLMEGPRQNSLSAEMAESIAALRTRIESDLGVPVPGVRVRGNETDFPDGTYVILLMEVPVASGIARPSERFCIASEDDLAKLGVSGTPAADAASGTTGVWLAEKDWDTAGAAGFTLWDPREFLARQLEAVIRRNLRDFVDVDDVLGLLDDAVPGAREALRADADRLTSLVTVCRAIVAEQAPLRPFDEVWGEFDRRYSSREPLERIVESIRALPAVRARLLANDARRRVLPLGPAFEHAIEASIAVSGSHSLLAMEPERCQAALSAVRDSIADGVPAVIVAGSSELRPHARRLIELEFPNVPVVSRGEVLADVQPDGGRPIDLDEDVPRPATRPVPSPRAATFPGVAPVPSDGADPATVGVTLHVSEKLIAQRSDADAQSLTEMLALMSEGLYYELGLLLPEVRIAIDNRLPVDTFTFTINGRSFPPARGLEPNEFLVNDSPDRLTLLNIGARAAINPANGAEAAVVRGAEQHDLCRSAGLTVWGPAGFVVLTLTAAIRSNAPAFLTRQITRLMLDSHGVAYPALTEAALERFTVDQIRLLLQHLLEEEISIRDLRSILTSMTLVNGTAAVDLSEYIVFPLYTGNLVHRRRSRDGAGVSIGDYAEFVRCSLKRQISHKYTRGGSTMVVYLMHPDIERTITALGERLSQEERDRLLTAVGNELGALPPTAATPVILTTLEARKPLWRLIRNDFPRVAVVDYQELSPDLNIQPIARISWDAARFGRRPLYRSTPTAPAVRQM